MAESTGDFTLNISDFGTTTNPDGTPATGPLFGTDQGAAAEDAEPDLWESSKLGDNMYLKPFFESAEKALDLHRANAKFIKDFYELNKALLLAGIDPFFAAIDAILDEIIKLIQDLRGLGFYMLPVTATSIKQNVTKNPITGSLFYGGQQYVPARRNSNGELVPAGLLPGSAAFSSGQIEAKKRAAGVDTASAQSFITGEAPVEGIMGPEAIDRLAVAKDPISGEINYVKVGTASAGGTAASDDPTSSFQKYLVKPLMMLNPMTNLVQLTPAGVLQIIDESFDDPGDIPKHVKELIMQGKTEVKASSWVPETDLKEWSDLVDPSYYQSGRPIFSASARVGGMIFIVGAPDANRFLTILENFQKFFDIRSFGNMTNELKALWADHDTSARVLVQHVARVDIQKKDVNTVGDGTTAEEIVEYQKGAEQAGAFVKQERKGSRKTDRRVMSVNNGAVARIKEVIDTKKMLIEKYESGNFGTFDSKDMDPTESRIRAWHKGKKVDKNKLPYQQQILEVVYQKPDQTFKAGDIIVECLPNPQDGPLTTDDESGNPAKTADLQADAKAAPSAEGDSALYSQIKPGKIVVGKVVNSFWADAQGTPPNWHGKSLDTLIPGWGPFLDKMEAEVRGVKETVATAKKSLDPIINWLDGKMKELEVFSKDLENILDLFANGLAATGVYTLYLKPKTGGVKKFRERMMAAGGPDKPPEDLKFCAGVCFLGGGTDAGAATFKAIDMLALLLGLRDTTAAEKEKQKTLTAMAIPVWTNVGPLDADGNPTTKVYKPGDRVYFRGKNYECIKNTSDDPSETGAPLIKDPALDPDTGVPSGLYILNGLYWKQLEITLGPDEQVIAGDERTPAQIQKDKKAWLQTTKITLQSILSKIDGADASSLRSRIMRVPLFGTIDIATVKFIGENYNIFLELKQMRDNLINEVDLLVQRIEEMLTEIEVMLIQTSPGSLFNATTEPYGIRPGSLRTKGKTLMIVGGGVFKDFVDEDDFALGDRKIKKNTTITIMDPLSDSSGATRAVEKISNTTVAVLEEAFPADIDTALSYDVPRSYAIDSDYANDPANKINDWPWNGSTYWHPGYRLREFYAKANTVSVVLPASDGQYKDLPVFEGGQIGPQGSPRTTQYYPEGTIIKLNGTAAVSEGFVQGGGVDVVGNVERTATSWMGIGVSQDDLLVIDFGNDNEVPQAVSETIGLEYLAVAEPFRIGAGAIERFVYHENWSVKISDASQAEAAAANKIQASRNAFKKQLAEINEHAKIVYRDLDILSNKNWPPAPDEATAA